MDELRFLDPGTVRASLPEGSSHLRIEIEGERCILHGSVRRAFPLTDPSEYLSVQEEGGKPVGLLRSMDGLDDHTKALIRADLDRRYFSPCITRIESLRPDASMWRFQVQTTRGPILFYVRNWRDSAHEVAPNRWFIQAVDGQRFEIRDMEALDAKSRSFLDQLL